MQDATDGEPSEKQNTCDVLNDPLAINSPGKELPISCDEIKNRAQQIKKLFVTEERAREIESETRNQSENPQWHFYRGPRLTASKCHRIASLKTTTSPSKAIRDILYALVRPTSQMREGLAMEGAIQDEYIAEQVSAGHDNLTVRNSGFIASWKSGFLGASPGRLVCDPSEPDAEGLLEMKFNQTNESET